MKLLGAILAGGASRRFGRDKALALIDGRPMLDHVAGRLNMQCDALVVVGRDWPGLERVSDLPAPGLGPLGGLAGALAYAERNGFDAVLTSGCDLPGLPVDLRDRLKTPNALVRGQPTIGLWESGLATRLAGYLENATDLSVRAWALSMDARWIAIEEAIPNINTPADLAAFRPS
ncbi:molybdenum cofactor guanylyltransferase [Sphingomonas sp. PR090111-T3T-6A]|uniref:molybdenum cofactor guanylyltransferase n=1 Tax=Sphingomonas sp. PR090111-T3T-6A TaxID=685778 RepID=UPI00036975E3|nr:molybdenum cofactor guanylyltransferase [Sphingomonas sp. PR090111-T3T-6A]